MPESPPPLISLLTDFGTADTYVGVMKGIILGICPSARIVDLTHEIPPQDVAAAAFALDAAWSFFPEGTIHVAVVDPEVGTERHLLAVRAGGQFFLAPDNGLLEEIIARPDPVEIRLVENPACFRRDISTTFHGRDKFAPTAAQLAIGDVAFEDLGPPADRGQLRRRSAPRPSIDGTTGTVTGQVLSVDRFGNLVTNITAAALPPQATVHVAGTEAGRIPLRRTYRDVPAGQLVALVGSSGRLEVALNQGSAADRLGAGRDDVVTVVPVPA